MIRWLSKAVLRLFGWHTNGALPDGIRKAVVVSAPHTSYWDFVVGLLTFKAIRVNIRFLIKKEIFVFPLGWLLERAGGLAVDRGKYKSNMVTQVVKMFNEHESLVVVITPEGTRRLMDHWKKGFYLIAMEAGVPLALSFIDYKNKTGGIGPIFYPTGNYEEDLVFIQDFYRDKTACHPERFNLSPQNRSRIIQQTPFIPTSNDNNGYFIRPWKSKSITDETNQSIPSTNPTVSRNKKNGCSRRIEGS